MLGRISNFEMLFPNDLEFSGVSVVGYISGRITDNKRWPNIAGLEKSPYA